MQTKNVGELSWSKLVKFENQQVIRGELRSSEAEATHVTEAISQNIFKSRTVFWRVRRLLAPKA